MVKLSTKKVLFKLKGHFNADTMYGDEDCSPESELVVSKVVVSVEGGPHAVHEAGGDPGNTLHYIAVQ